MGAAPRVCPSTPQSHAPSWGSESARTSAKTCLSFCRAPAPCGAPSLWSVSASVSVSADSSSCLCGELCLCLCFCCDCSVCSSRSCWRTDQRSCCTWNIHIISRLPLKAGGLTCSGWLWSRSRSRWAGTSPAPSWHQLLPSHHLHLKVSKQNKRAKIKVLSSSRAHPLFSYTLGRYCFRIY